MINDASAGRRCDFCRASLSADSRFCEHCGREVAIPESGHGPGYASSKIGTTAESSASPAFPAPGGPWTASVPRAVGPVPGIGGGDHDALLGAPSENETYLGNRLSYTDRGTNFDPLGNPDYQRGLISQFLATVAAWVLGSVVLFLIFGLVGFIDSLAALRSQLPGLGYGDSSDGTSSVGSVALVLWTILQNALSIVLALLFWLRKIPVQVSEWMITVDGKAHVARSALDHMYAIVTVRRSPVRDLRVIRFARSDEESRFYLRLSDGVYTGFVASFGYGSDLYIGWTYWLNMSPARWLVKTLERMVRGHGVGIYGSVAFDRPKALREVMHSAVRQGVDMATGEAEPRGQGLIGTSVMVKDVSW